MTEELNIAGVYIHPLLAAAIMAFIAARLLEWGLQVLGVYRWVWHRGLFDIALTIILWGGFAYLLTLT
ncbi:DUF1656 domain-containing protein [Asticcacaulis sp. 201]|uniref:DUF1656 domain-containing protein n=1 Tax=Asticcacaulis sp. 201 TaxID=3028787 RepID=UPI002915E750|nr:DUF1656 domain-containing protein [Asticcacaulis sp. 201]MDV6330759.1 DUF1656 domain-containing protein [Asticcacaulis sp. 201]